MSFHDARSQQRDTLAASLLPAYVTGRGVAVERELKMKLKTTHHLLLAITFSLAPLSAAVPFTDGFETGALNPFWTIEPGPGFVSMTTQAAHSGAQSLKHGVPLGSRGAPRLRFRRVWLHLRLGPDGRLLRFRDGSQHQQQLPLDCGLGPDERRSIVGPVSASRWISRDRYAAWPGGIRMAPIPNRCDSHWSDHDA
jgi:hypothetical protein